MSNINGMGWQASALCAQTDPGLFHHSDDSQGVNLTIRAKKVCAGCPVWRECRFTGMAEPYGVWGGLAERERRNLRAWAGITTPDRYDEFLDAVRSRIYRAMRLSGGDVDTALDHFPSLARHPAMLDFHHAAAS